MFRRAWTSARRAPTRGLSSGKPVTYHSKDGYKGVSMRNLSADNWFAGKVQLAVLDWSGTTADAFVIAPAYAFVEVFEKYKASCTEFQVAQFNAVAQVPISMEEARLPMGLRKDLHIKVS